MEERKSVRYCCTRTRFLLLPVLLLSLSSLWSNILSFNVAYICARSNNTHDSEHDFRFLSGWDAILQPRIFVMSESEQTWMQLAVSIGALAAHFPLVYLLNRYGIRAIFSALGLLSGITTLVLPQAVQMDVKIAFAIRLIQGASFASTFIVIGIFASTCTYHKQNGLFVSTLVASLQVSPSLTNPLSGIVCEPLGWPSIFYLHGLFGVLIFTVFVVVFRDVPAKHPMVGQLEAFKIAVNKPCARGSKGTPSVPYGSVLTTASVWAVWIAAMGNFFYLSIVYLYSPDYFHYVLDLQTENAGFVAALPTVAQFVLKMTAGHVSDKIRSISEGTKFRIFNSLAFFGSALFAAVLGLVTGQDAGTKLVCEVLLSASVGMMGLASGGFFKAAASISGRCASFVTGNISIAFFTAMIIAPLVKTRVAPNDTAQQWKILFWISSAILVLSNVVFLIFIRGRQPAWASENPTVSNGRRKVHPVSEDAKVSEMRGGGFWERGDDIEA